MDEATSIELRLMQEWLVTNGLGGYASGTVSGVLTRRYHGYLISKQRIKRLRKKSAYSPALNRF